MRWDTYHDLGDWSNSDHYKTLPRKFLDFKFAGSLKLIQNEKADIIIKKLTTLTV